MGLVVFTFDDAGGHTFVIKSYGYFRHIHIERALGKAAFAEHGCQFPRFEQHRSDGGAIVFAFEDFLRFLVGEPLARVDDGTREMGRFDMSIVGNFHQAALGEAVDIRHQ